MKKLPDLFIEWFDCLDEEQDVSTLLSVDRLLEKFLLMLSDVLPLIEATLSI